MRRSRSNDQGVASGQAESNVFRVSNSKVKTWRRCQYAAHLKYVEKLRKKRKARPLVFGTLVHSIIEAEANGERWRKVLRDMSPDTVEMFRSEADAYGEILSDIECIMSEYFIKYEGSVDYIRLQRKSAEHEFEVEVEDGLVVTGKIDAFVRTPNRLKWLMEHKTFTRMPSEDNHWRNTQSVVYHRINEILGWVEIDGILWDYIHSAPPKRPQLLKSGGLSRKGINTLPSRVIETIRDHGLREKDYQQFIDQAANNRKHYFQRVFTPTKKEVVDKVWTDFIYTAREMRDNLGRAKAKNIDRHCDWCEFESICRAELRCGDVDYVKENDFYVHKKDDYEREVGEVT